MSFEDIAQRMKDRRTTTHIGGIPGMALGEDLPDLPVPAPPPPAKRRSALIAAYLVLFAGILIAMVAGIVLIAFYGSTSTWVHRGLMLAIALGGGLIIQSTVMFDSAAATAALPDARLRN